MNILVVIVVVIVSLLVTISEYGEYEDRHYVEHERRQLKRYLDMQRHYMMVERAKGQKERASKQKKSKANILKLEDEEGKDDIYFLENEDGVTPLKETHIKGFHDDESNLIHDSQENNVIQFPESYQEFDAQEAANKTESDEDDFNGVPPEDFDF